MNAIQMLRDMEHNYRNGGWAAGTLGTPNPMTPLGFQGCLVGTASFIESGRGMIRSSLEVAHQPSCVAFEVLRALSRDPEVGAFCREHHGRAECSAYLLKDYLSIRPAEFYNDCLIANGGVTAEQALEKVLALIGRTIARLEAETPEPEPTEPEAEPEVEDVDGEDQSEEEPVEGALALA